ncbi:MAG: hypothetical protein ACK5V3_02340 [Bdellovibrionales bacterium]
MIRKKTSVIIGFILTFVLTSCIEEPKKKKEEPLTSDQFEKTIDSVIGAGSINPNGIAPGDENVMVQTINVSNSLVREIFRRKLKVLSVECDTNNCENAREWLYKFEVEVIERDSNGIPQAPTSKVRSLLLKVNADGFYEFYGDSHEHTAFSWDSILDLRGLCRSFKTDEFDVQVTCSSLTVEAETWGPQSIMVRKLSVNREVQLTNLLSGEKIESKLRFSVRFATNKKEISKVVSFCTEGMQKIENQVYFITRCNNLESL